jgi:acetyltransferase
MPQTSLTEFFNPRSVAIIGASRDPNKVGYITLKNLIDSGYNGDLFPINPNATEILGKKVYASLSQIGHAVDLAIICLPASTVLDILTEIVGAKIHNVVIFSAGFKELGEEGAKAEQQIKKLAGAHNLNILGPNCLGFINSDKNLNATFGKSPLYKNNLNFISQSGAMATSLIDWANKVGFGFNKFITLGNKTTLNENDFLKEIISNNLAPLGLYLESISDGVAFINLAKNLTQKYPVFIIKPGKSAESQSAMKSHTGAIAGADDVVDQALKEAGVIRCENLEEMFEISKVLAWGKVPHLGDIAIISNAGGPAVISADACAEYGIKLALLSKSTKKTLAEKLPREASFINPVDVLGDAMAQRYKDALEIVIKEPTVSTVLVILTPQMMTEIKLTAEVIKTVQDKFPDKPIYCSFMGGSEIQVGKDILNREQIPSFDYPEIALRIISLLQSWRQYQKDIEVTGLASISSTHSFKIDTSSYKDKILTSEESLNLCKVAGFNIPEFFSVDGLTTVQVPEFPVVLKLSAKNLVHKKDVGGVVTNINTQEELNSKVSEMQKLNVGNAKIIVQRQIDDPAIEVIAGVKTDPSFGKVLLFGAGGTLVEIIKDKNLITLNQDFDEKKIINFINKSKVAKLINGYRNDEKFNIQELARLLLQLISFVKTNDEIQEIEINPIMVTRKNVWVVDPKITLI